MLDRVAGQAAGDVDLGDRRSGPGDDRGGQDASGSPAPGRSRSGPCSPRRSRPRSVRSGCRRPSGSRRPASGGGPRRSGPGWRRSRSRSVPGSGRAGSRTPRASRNSTVASSPSRVPTTSGIATTSTPQSGAAARLVAFTLRTRSAPPRTARATSAGSKLSTETRIPRADQLGHGPAHVGPDSGRVAADVDPVGPLGDEGSASARNSRGGEPGGVVDLGEDLDVERAVAFEPAIVLAEESGEVAEVLGPDLHRDPGPGFDRGEVAPAVAGEDDPGDSGGNLQVAGDPMRRHQGGHGDRQGRHLGPDPRPGGQVVEDRPERGLGQAAGDEEDQGRGLGGRWCGHGRGTLGRGSADRAAVDPEGLAGQEVRGRRDQEERGGGDVFGRAPASHRGFADRAGLPGFGGRFAPGGPDPAGG